MRTYRIPQGGFTLIELLVVIAIIGVLASVVLAGLSSGRSKSKDASIKGQMSEMRKQAALYYTENGTYGVNFTQDSAAQCYGSSGTVASTMFTTSLNGAGPMVQTIAAQIPTGLRAYCAVSATQSSWAFAAPLNSPAGTSTGWCVDSTGSSKAVSIGFAAIGSPLGGGVSLAQCP
jgi:prepilin-type N-terminal cleavage/methylation domain-containing protein